MNAIPLPNQAHTRNSRILRQAHVTDIGLKCKHWEDQSLTLSHSVSSLCELINSAAVSSENCKRSEATTSSRPTTEAKTRRVEAAEVNFRKLQRDTTDGVTKFQMQLDTWQNITEQERYDRRKLIRAAEKLGKCAEANPQQLGCLMSSR